MLNRLADYEPSLRSPDSKSGEPTSTAALGASRPFLCASDVQGIVQPVEDLILRYPGAALASAFFVGVLVAWWIKRK